MDKLQRIESVCRQLYCTAKFFRPSTVLIKQMSTGEDNETRNLKNEKSEVQESKTGNLTDEANTETESTEQKKSGFAKSFEKFSHLDEIEGKHKAHYTFAKLLRNSKFIDLGDPEGKIVSGKIFQTVGDDLYIDFGWKFYCVCRRPVKNGQYYVRGSVVRLRIKDLELSTRFLGATTDVSLLEADCTLMGLISSPLKQNTITKSS